VDLGWVWKIALITLVFLGIASPLLAQEVEVLVYFKDKDGSAYGVEDAPRFLSARSRQRRQKFGIPVITRDLPVSAFYISQLRDAGLSVGKPSKWLNAVVVKGDSARLASMLNSPSIRAKEQLTKYTSAFPVIRRQGVPSALASIVTENNYGIGTNQAHMLGIDSMHASGLTGKGVVVAVMDAGFQGVERHLGFAHLRDSSRIRDTYNFLAEGGPDVYGYHWHGGGALTCIGGNYQSFFVGGAYDADYALYISEDVTKERPIEMYNWVLAAERADSLGADLINTSLGYSVFDKAWQNLSLDEIDGSSSIITQGVQIAASVGMLCVTSAGNEGSNPFWRGKISAPADAPDGVTVGALLPDSNLASFSSRGIAGKPYIKPDVVAQGVGCVIYHPTDPTAVNFVSGTSFSAPLVAGLIAGLMERYPNKKPTEWIEALHATGSRASTPDTTYGYGIPNYQRLDAYLGKKVLNFQGKAFLIFPNPQVRGAGIQVLVNQAFTPRLIEVVNMLGQVVREVNLLPDSGNTIGISSIGLLEGAYVVRLRDARGTHVSRLVLQQ
jgi:serine protease AprX